MTDTRGQLLIEALVLFLGACAIANTPQQDLAAPYVQLEHVDLDGRITFKISNEGEPARDPAMPRRSRPHGATASRACEYLAP